MYSERDMLLIDDIMRLMITTRKNWLIALEQIDKSNSIDQSLTPQKYLMLLLLSKNKKMTISELGNLIGLSSGAITTAVSIMVKNKLIDRSKDMHDRRVIWLQLTEEGFEVMQGITAQLHSLWAPFLGKLSTEESEQFQKFISRILS